MLNTFYANIKDHTLQNEAYRRVLYTLPNFQLVVMSLKPNVEIGREIHKFTTQFIRVEKGSGYAVINDVIYNLFDDLVIVIPFNTYHNIINNSKEDLKLYTIYSGEVQHLDGLVEMEKPEND